MPLYLAIDGGGTKTRCLLADEERVLARAETGTVKLMRVGDAEASERLRAMLAEAAGIARVALGDVRRTCFGLAGSRSESVQQWAKRAIAASGAGGKVEICGDEEIALNAAFRDGPGILVIAGTGSHAIGRSGDGAVFRAGGWGPVLGDGGSGYWIGVETLRAALRAEDEGDDGAAAELLREIEGEWNAGSLEELVALGNLRAPSETPLPADFAALTPVVVRCADQGNPIAIDVLLRAGEELANLVTLVARKLNHCRESGSFCESYASRLDIALAGSVLAHIPAVRAAMISKVAATLPAAHVSPTVVDPLDGSLWRVRKSSWEESRLP